MITIQEVREKYPQYQKLSDEDIADRLYKKHYEGKISRPEFYQKLGLSSKSGWSGVGKDIQQSLLNAAPRIYEGLTQGLPQELMGIGQQAIQEPTRPIRNATLGLANLPMNIANIPSNAAQYLSKKGIIGQDAANMIPRSMGIPDLDRILGLQQKQPGDFLAESVGSFAPIGGAASAISRGASGLRRAATMGGAGALHSAGMNEDPILGALSVIGPEAFMKGARNISAPDLTPSNLVAKAFGGGNAQRIAENARVAEGTNTGLGRILESPSLIGLEENVLPHKAGSGAERSMNKATEHVVNRGNDLLERLSTNAPDKDPNFVIQEALQAAYENQKNVKNRLYSDVEKIAQQEGFKLNLDNFKNRASSIADTIHNSVISLIPEVNSLYKKMLGILDNKGVVTTGSDSLAALPTLKDAKLLKGHLYNLAQDYKSSPNPSDGLISSELSSLSQAIDSDIKQSIKNTGSKKLDLALEHADDYYKDNYSNWLDKEAFKIRRDNPETLIQSVIGSGKKLDKFSRLEKIQNLLPEDQKGLIAYGYLSKALDRNGYLNPNELAKLINSLGDRQKKALFPDGGSYKSAVDFTDLARLNQKSLNKTFNPDTGKTALSLLPYGELGAAFGGLALGNPAPAIGLAVATGLSNLINKKLRSPEFRSKVIEKSQKKEAKKEKGEPKKLSQLEKDLTLVIPYSSSAQQKKEGKK
jgi:hypothetical protein